MLARLPAYLSLVALGGLVGGLLVLFAAPAYAPPAAAPVRILDAESGDQVARVTEDGAVRVTGDVQVSGAATVDGAVEVSNLPETQDVRVVNGRGDPVPVTLDTPASGVTVNSFTLTAAPGESDEFTVENSFQGLTMFFTSVTGAQNGELIVFLDFDLNSVMVLRGEAGSGIGQEDHSISLTHLIEIGGVRVSCPATATSNCEVEVSVTGYS